MLLLSQFKSAAERLSNRQNEISHTEDKKKVSFSLVEMQIYSDANYRPYPIFDDKVVMDKYNLEYTVVIHCITFTN